jgi:DNA-binding beta-propeller fold protein YncE
MQLLAVLGLLAGVTSVLVAAPARADTPATYVSRWGSRGTGPGQFDGPRGIDVGPDGSVYVADGDNNRIVQFTASGQFLRQWGTEGTGAGQFQFPVDVATDSAGNVYVADDFNSRIQKFTSTGQYLRQWGGEGSGTGQFVGVGGIAIDAADTIYATDSLNGRVHVFSANGTLITTWGVFGSRPDQLAFPGAIAIDNVSGHVVIADASERIKTFTLLGRHVRTWGTNGSAPGQLDDVAGLDVDPFGNVFVADFSNNRVQKFTPGGRLLARWGQRGTAAGQFRFTSDVAVQGRYVYVSDLNNHRIQRFRSQRYLGWAALGDSYSAGVGLGPVTQPCDRDQDAYAPRASRTLAAGAFDAGVTFLACSGDTVGGLRAAQLSSVNPHHNIVTMSIGGNDIGFADKVKGCWVGACGDDTLRLSADRPGGSQTWDQVFDRLVSLYVDVLHRMQAGGRLFVVGYPVPFARARAATCQGLTGREQNAANALVTRLDDTISLAVDRANEQLGRAAVRFVDWRTGTRVHDGYTISPGYPDSGQRFDTYTSPDGLCNNAGRTPFINGFVNWAPVNPDASNSFHPNDRGYAFVAGRLAAAISG